MNAEFYALLKTYWLCEEFENMQPLPVPHYLAKPAWSIQVTRFKKHARRFTTKQECSDQCPPGFFPTEHTDA